MPTFLFFKSGKKIDEVVGADIAKVERLVKSLSSGAAGIQKGQGRVLGTGEVKKESSIAVLGNIPIGYAVFALFLLYLFLTK